MASHRRPKQASKARASVLTAAAATAVAISAGNSAQADPKPSKSEVKEKLDKYNEQAEAANEKYVGAKEKQNKLQKQVNRLQNQVAGKQEGLNKLQDSVAKLATAEYRSGGIDPTVQLMLSSDPEKYLDKAQALDHVSGRQAEQIDKVVSKKKALDRKRSSAAGKLKQLHKTTAQAAASKTAMHKKVTKAQHVLNSLNAAERKAMKRKEAKEAEQAQQKAEQASSNSGGDSSSASGGGGGSASASGRASAALSAARGKLGTPYVYGATGPNSFDCSSFTQYAWKAAGVSLPRTSQAQASAGTPVSGLSAAKPGDLIIYYGSMTHVGMYVGHGQIIHAPHTGASVRYEGADSMPITKIVRPG